MTGARAGTVLSAGILAATGAAASADHPLTMHMQMATGPSTIDMYIANGYLYQRLESGAWSKQSLPPGIASPSFDVGKTLADATSVSLGPDVTEDGTTYGDLDISVKTAQIAGAPAAPPLTLSCTYDKKTYRTHACKNALFNYTMTHYDDPANAIVLPPELATAVDRGPLPLPFPVPSPSP